MRMFLCALVLGAIPAAALADTVTYDCRMKNLGPTKGWITERYIIVHDTATDEVTALDAILNAMSGGPVRAKVADKSKAKTAFSWSFRSNDTRNRSATTEYRAAIYADGKITITAKPLGYRNMFESRGACEKSVARTKG